MLLILTGILFGIFVGILTSIIPGFGSMQSALIAGAIGVVSTAAVAPAVFSAIVISLFLNSAKEGIDPSLSGNASVIAASPVNAGKELVNQTFASKIGGTLAGMAVALLMSHFGIVVSTSATITIMIALFLVYALGVSLNRHVVAIIGFLGLTQIYFVAANAMAISNPVYLLISGLFIIPASLRALESRPLNNEEQSENAPEPVKSLVGMLVSFIAPGVGSSLIVSTLSRKNTPSSQLSASFCEAALESFCLLGVAFGAASGKSILAMELGLASFSGYFIPLFIGLILLSWILLPVITNVFRSVAQTPGVHLFSCGATVASCVLLAGPIGLFICMCGLLTTMILRALNVPSNVLSLAFLSPILL